MGERLEKVELSINVKGHLRKVDGKIVRVGTHKRDGFLSGDAVVADRTKRFLKNEKRVAKEGRKTQKRLRKSNRQRFQRELSDEARGPLSSLGFRMRGGKLRSKHVTVSAEDEGFRVGLNSHPKFDARTPSRKRMRRVAAATEIAASKFGTEEVAERLEKAHEVLMALETQAWFHDLVHDVTHALEAATHALSRVETWLAKEK